MRLIDAEQFGVISLQGKSEEFIEGVKFMFDKIHEAPTVERPHGEWEHWGSPFSDDSIANSIVCSLCKARYVEIEDEVFNFCPNCGASMWKEGDEKCE